VVLRHKWIPALEWLGPPEVLERLRQEQASRISRTLTPM